MMPPLEALVLDRPIELELAAVLELAVERSPVVPLPVEAPVELPLFPVLDEPPDEEADPEIPPPLLIPEPLPLMMATPDWQAQSPRVGSTAAMTTLNDAVVAIISLLRGTWNWNPPRG